MINNNGNCFLQLANYISFGFSSESEILLLLTCYTNLVNSQYSREGTNKTQMEDVHVFLGQREGHAAGERNKAERNMARHIV